MLNVILGLLGICCVAVAVNSEDNRVSMGAFIVGGILVVLAFASNPVDMLAGIGRDTRDFDSKGNPNYWYDLNTGKRYHMEDGEVAACEIRNEVIEINGQDVLTCTMFGDGPGRLYPGLGAIIEINRSIHVRSRTKGEGRGTIVWPGQPVVVGWQTQGVQKVRGCWDIYAKDPNGNVMASESGLEYRLKQDGVWGAWFKRPDVSRKSVVLVAQEVEWRTPDDLPRAFMAMLTATEFAVTGNPGPRKMLVCLEP